MKNLPFLIHVLSLVQVYCQLCRDNIKPLANPCLDPLVLLNTSWGNDYGDFKCGDKLETSDVGQRPKLKLSAKELSADAYYTVLMVDTDYPSNIDHNLSDFLHWVVLDVRGTNFTQENGFDINEFRGNSSLETTEYMPPNPHEGSGEHRYAIYLLKQLGQYSLWDVHLRNKGYRHSFDLTDFRKSSFLCYGMEAGFQFILEHDWQRSTVPPLTTTSLKIETGQGKGEDDDEEKTNGAEDNRPSRLFQELQIMSAWLSLVFIL